MKMINTVEMTKDFLSRLAEVEQDIELLTSRIATAKEKAQNLPDEVDEKTLEELDEELDLEKGLKHIRLF